MKKDLLILAAIVLVVVFIATGTKIQSVEDFYLTHIDEITEDSETVFIGIECSTILDNWEALDNELKFEKYVPSNGVILGRSDDKGKYLGGIEYVLRPGDTVYSILDRARRHNKIQMEAEFSYNYTSVYVRGINHLYEFSCGPLSGWMYKVNGEYPNFGCSQFKLKDGDIIEWRYTCDLGRDIDGYFGE